MKKTQIVIDIPDYIYCDIQAYNTIFSDNIEEVAKAIKYGTPLPECQGMDDLISRQAAIDALKRAEALTRAFGYHVVIDTIRELPSAQQKVRKDDNE